MAIWVKQAGHWLKAHAFAPYLPPDYLRIYPHGEAGPRWRASGAMTAYGADRLEEFLEALMRACMRPRGRTPPSLWRVEGDKPLPVTSLSRFPSQHVLKPGLELARLRQPPDKWLLALHVARPVRGLAAARTERYLGSWHSLLEGLLAACSEANHSRPRRSGT